MAVKIFPIVAHYVTALEAGEAFLRACSSKTSRGTFVGHMGKQQVVFLLHSMLLAPPGLTPCECAYQADIKCADGVLRPKSFCEAKIDEIND